MKSLVRFFLVGLSLVSACSASAHADPLFDHMLGHWSGTGFRVEVNSGERIQVTEDVITTPETIRGLPAIVSRDQITESPSSGSAHVYVTEYWVQARPGQPGSYVLGGQESQGPGPAGAIGVVGADGVFRVDQYFGQDLGNGYVVHSETRFVPGGTLYTETLSYAGTAFSHTEIRFTAATRSVTSQNR